MGAAFMKVISSLPLLLLTTVIRNTMMSSAMMSLPSMSFSRAAGGGRRVLQHRTTASATRATTTSLAAVSSSPTTSSSSDPGAARTISRLPPVPSDCHRFIMMRHGQSSFNDAAIFTGWCDVALTRRGVVEALEAGEVFRSHNLQFRKCYTSLLTRSIITAQRCLEAAGVAYTQLSMDWRLNVSVVLN